MRSQKLVSIIIVNWNGKKWLKICLLPLYKQRYKNFEVILVDNGSRDGSVGYVKTYYPLVKIIQNDSNYGFAQANNIGFKEAQGEYVLFLNNDTKVTKNFLIELVSAIEKDEKISGVQSKILLMEKPDTLDSAGAYLTPSGFLYHFGVHKKDAPKYNQQMFIYSAKGAAMMFRRSVLQKILVNGELFDSRFFAYFEETDMSHRIWLAGYKILYVPNSIIYHQMGGTSSRLDYHIIQFHSFKNRINAYIKNLGKLQLLMILPIHIVLCEIHAVVSLFTKNKTMFLVIQKAIFWNILHLSETLALRKIVQKKIRRLSDHQLTGYIYKYPKLAYYYHLRDLRNYEE